MTEEGRSSDAYYRELLSRVDDAISDSAANGNRSGMGGSGSYGFSSDNQTMTRIKYFCKESAAFVVKAILFVVALLIELFSTFYNFISKKYSERRDASEEHFIPPPSHNNENSNTGNEL